MVKTTKSIYKYQNYFIIIFTKNGYIVQSAYYFILTFTVVYALYSVLPLNVLKLFTLK